MKIRATAARLVFILGLSVVLPAIAAEQTIALEEIVVTAQKRAENAQKVPVAIDAFSGAALETKGVVSLEDLKSVSSSFNLNNGAGNAQAFVRGVGSNVPGNGVYGSVATYIDGAYIPRGYSLASGAGSLQNLESIQVLKGPQGTLYGRNATGGALVITTKTPHAGDPVGGWAKVSAGNFGLKQGSASIYGGFGANFAGLLSVDYHKNDGYIKNLGGTNRGNLDDSDGYSVKGKLTFKPTDNVELLFSATHNVDKQSPLGFQQVGQYFASPAPGFNDAQLFYFLVLGQFGVPPSIAGPAAAGVQFSNTHAATFSNEVSAFKNGVIKPKHIDLNQGAGGWYGDDYLTFKANIGFDKFDFVATTAYNASYSETAAEVLRADPKTTLKLSTLGFPASFDVPNVGFSGLFDDKAVSQEVYLISKKSAIDWVAGVYYFRETGNTQLAGDAFGNSARVANNDFSNDSISAYAEGTFTLRDRLRLTTGARYSREENIIDDKIVNGDPLNQAGVANVGHISQTSSSPTYNVKLTYQADTWMVYGGYTTGFKSGALNTNDPKGGKAGPEKIKSTEVGFKSNPANGRVRFNGSAFHYDYDNIQLSVLNPGTGANVLVDKVKAKVNGLELEVQTSVTNDLSAFASTTLLDAKYKSDAYTSPLTGPPQLLQKISGNKMTLAPRTTIVAGFDYRIPAVSVGQLAVNVSANYNSGFYIDQTNTFGSGGPNNDSFTTANLNLKYTSASKAFTASLFGNNLTDAKYFVGGIDAFGGLTKMATAGRPRNYGLILEYKY